jgi:delta 1-pyrroline-5-carboxylate dehydrogenase
MRRKRPALQSNLVEHTLKTLQGGVDHLRVRVDHSAPDDLACRVDNANRRPLAAHVKSCKHCHRCSPFVSHESPAKG